MNLRTRLYTSSGVLRLIELSTVLLLLGLLTACQSKLPAELSREGFDSTRSREWTGALTPADRGNCPIQFEATRLQAFLASHQGNFDGYRIETSRTPVECTLSRNFEGRTQTRQIKGFTRLLLYSKIQLTGDFALMRDSSSATAEILWLGAKTVSPSPEVKRRLLDELAFAPAAATIQDSFYEMYSQIGLIDFATLANSNSEATSKVEVEVASYRWPTRMTEAFSLRFPKGFPLRLSPFLAAFKRGEVPITLYTTRMRTPLSAHFYQWQLYLPADPSDSSGSTDSLTHLPLIEILARLWEGSTQSPDRDLEQGILISNAVSWLTHAQHSHRAIREQLAPLIQFAQQLWATNPTATEIQTRAKLYIDSLKLLQLAQADETNPRVIQLKRLAPFYDSAYLDPAEYVREIIALVGQPYAGDQQASVEELASELKAAHFTGVQAWKKARGLAEELKRSAAEITRFASIFHWMSQNIRAGFDADQALAMTHSFYFDRKITPQDFELVQGAFGWLTSLSGPHLYGPTAFSKTQTYVFEKSLTPEELSTLKATYAWLRSDPDAISGGPGLFTSAALSKAELYVLDRSHTLETLDLFKRVYPWLIASEGPGLSVSGGLAKAESLIYTRGLTTAQFSLMGELFHWLKSPQHGDSPAPGLYPSFALAKCEEYLFQRRFSAEQFALLKDATHWLASRSGPSLSVSSSFLRAEKYLFLKQMSRERFEALKKAFATSGTTLEQAEVLTFGSRVG